MARNRKRNNISVKSRLGAFNDWSIANNYWLKKYKDRKPKPEDKEF